MFSYGGASAESEGRGGNKKIIVGIAAAVVVSALAYAGYAHFKSGEGNPVPEQTPVTQSVTASPQPAKPAAVQPAAPATTTHSSAPTEAVTSNAPADSANDAETAPKETASHPSSSAKPAKQPSAAAPKTASAPKTEDAEQTEPEPAPMVVKPGKVSNTTSKSAQAADAPAPSLIGMSTPGSAPPPDLIPTTGSNFKPVLQTVSVSQGVSTGLLYKKVAPVYPPSALRMRIEGKVELMATISKSGDITQDKVLSGDKQLAGAAVNAVKQWKYKPYLLNGEPVEIQTQVSVNFKMPN
jgi:protein TonB